MKNCCTGEGNMSIWHIRGGTRLRGSVRVQGSKNAVLPVLAASILTPCESEIINCPQLSDVDAAIEILRHLGCTAVLEGDTLRIDSRNLSGCTIPAELMHRMRSSVIFLGPLLGRCGEAHVSLPGGCELGDRPVDLHLMALRTLGAEVEQQGDEIVCRSGKLRGGEIAFSSPSVGATENAMIAACASEGDTVIYNAAREPEIVSLQDYLRNMGAIIMGAGTPVIRVRGFHGRSTAGFRVPPDRIVSATYLCCAAVTGGDVEVLGAEKRDMEAVLRTLAAMGCRISSNASGIRLAADERLSSPGSVVTRPYPGFPTDASPMLMAAAVAAEGCSVFIENIFSSRFAYAEELKKMGADIVLRGPLALVNGVERLHGAEAESTDLRGGAALITAALAAEGESRIRDEGHVARGYDGLESALRTLGAELWTE